MTSAQLYMSYDKYNDRYENADWAFQQPTIHRIYATTDVENVDSQRVLEKVGM